MSHVIEACFRTCPRPHKTNHKCKYFYLQTIDNTVDTHKIQEGGLLIWWGQVAYRGLGVKIYMEDLGCHKETVVTLFPTLLLGPVIQLGLLLMLPP